MSIFRSTTPHKLAAEQLRAARMALLDHQSAAEFNVAMARMLQERIARLETMITYLPEGTTCANKQ